MKTTIDIPEPLYKKAKIRAVENGVSLRQVVLDALGRALETAPVEEREASFFERRTLLPEYAAAVKAGAFSSGTDSSEMASDDRSDREEALL